MRTPTKTMTTKEGKYEPLNDRVGEFIFSSVLYGKMDKPPQVYLEVKDKDGNPVEIKLRRKDERA